MGCIGTWTEHGREPAAGRPAHRADEAGGRLAGRRLDAFPPTVGKGEPGDVHRDAAAVGTRPRTLHPVAWSTGEARSRPEGHQRPADDAAGQRRGCVADEISEAHGEGTADDGTIRPDEPLSVQPHRVEADRFLDGATGLIAWGKGGSEADARECQPRVADGHRSGRGWPCRSRSGSRIRSGSVGRRRGHRRARLGNWGARQGTLLRSDRRHGRHRSRLLTGKREDRAEAGSKDRPATVSADRAHGPCRRWPRAPACGRWRTCLP